MKACTAALLFISAQGATLRQLTVSDQAVELHAAAFAAAVRAEIHSLADRISPELEHKSDKAFFNKDYPWDKRPVADKYYVFDHPYPAVQDSGDYDADFVKDENSDGGRWQAQMEYDTLRTKIRQAKAKLDDLKKKMESEYEEWMRSKVKDAESSKAASEASKDAAGAKGAAEAATQKVNELEGSSSSKGTKVGGKVG